MSVFYYFTYKNKILTIAHELNITALQTNSPTNHIQDNSKK